MFKHCVFACENKAPCKNLDAALKKLASYSLALSNPPILRGSKKRRELGDGYFEALDTVFAGRVSAGADLV